MKKAAIVGATGYTGAELVRLLFSHSGFELGPLCGQSRAGEPVADVLPSFRGLLEGTIDTFDADAVAGACDVAFCALPHGASAGIVAELRKRDVVVFDLSADFRLNDREAYAEWYGEHLAPDLFGQAVYGLVELNREALRTADLVAVPGCYPTASNLALAPLVAEGLIDLHSISINALSGVSGAGRRAKAITHLPESSEGIRAYKAGGLHRHTPEIEQVLGGLAKQEIRLTFTPHLVPMTRGILITAYANAKDGVSAEQCTEAARKLFEGSASVAVLDAGAHPDTLWIRGSNRAHVAYHLDARAGRIVAMCTIDNLVKGAAGQAIQGANLRFGFDEAHGLTAPGAWP